ncbi:MAG: GNAT family N-acetyltransferase [Planktotalea sp.]|uniref:GNAT family N-acetyltransferase n=1 Tax=Planktotalea sp. TaxID=2029877 RepID=UPI003C725983
MEIRVLTGAAIADALPDLARLRIAVFRDWPYLYDGSAEYEERYLQVYTEAQGAVIVAVYDGETLVGAATGCPLLAHSDDFSAALASAALPLDKTFYCAESVLLPEYRGQGFGHVFFDRRETQAKALGCSHSVFCAVVRRADHPLKPAGYRPLDPFWRNRGYAPLDGAIARFDWQDIDQPVETSHHLQFWSKPL